ncbi:MAG: cytochrome c3 family protein [Desulfobacterales bacterium]|nr:cytochrome c3 family protein [Desulfobacterales bacterium]
MFKNKVSLLPIIVLMIAAASISFSKEMDSIYVPVGDLSISPPVGVTPKRSKSVSFPHSRHFDYNCKKCHHTWDGYSQVTGCMASGCHDLIKTSQETSAFRNYKTAFHKACIECHKEIRIKREEIEQDKTILKPKLPATGPTGCKECHIKEQA